MTGSVILIKLQKINRINFMTKWFFKSMHRSFIKCSYQELMKPISVSKLQICMALISHASIIMKIYPSKTKNLVHPKTNALETDNARVHFFKQCFLR